MTHKLLDKGGYGCVVTPPITDKKFVVKEILPYTKSNKKDVGKIFRNNKGHKFGKELEISNKMARIDPKGKYTTILKGANKLNNEFLGKNEKLRKCLLSKYFFSETNYYQIIMENGGLPFDEVKSHSVRYNVFLKMLRTFFKGMIEFQKLGYVHNDLKPGNVLINNKKISLIDFSLVLKKDEVYSNVNINSLSRYGYYYPPEYYIYYLKINNYSKKDIIYKITDHDFLLNSSEVADGNYETSVIQFVNVLEDKLKKYKLSEIFTPELALKADVFSFYHILDAVLYKHVIIYDNSQQKTFIEKLMNKIRNGNPFQRPSFQELYKIVNKEINK